MLRKKVSYNQKVEGLSFQHSLPIYLWNQKTNVYQLWSWNTWSFLRHCINTNHEVTRSDDLTWPLPCTKQTNKQKMARTFVYQDLPTFAVSSFSTMTLLRFLPIFHILNWLNYFALDFSYFELCWPQMTFDSTWKTVGTIYSHWTTYTPNLRFRQFSLFEIPSLQGFQAMSSTDCAWPFTSKNYGKII